MSKRAAKQLSTIIGKLEAWQNRYSKITDGLNVAYPVVVAKDKLMEVLSTIESASEAQP